VLPVSKTRIGHCIGCGACCKLPTPCLFLKTGADGLSFCAIYPARPLNCRKYPRTPSEWLTSDTCGFRFEPQPETNHPPVHGRLRFLSADPLHFFSLASWLFVSSIFKQLKKLLD
jgi:hypothetical protein